MRSLQRDSWPITLLEKYTTSQTWDKFINMKHASANRYAFWKTKTQNQVVLPSFNLNNGKLSCFAKALTCKPDTSPKPCELLSVQID